MKNRKFWNWINQTDEEPSAGRVLELYGTIAEESWFDDDVTPEAFRKELFAGSGPITIWISSPGGDCIAASQIYAMLMDYKGDVTVKIDGIAASAASVIAMAGTQVLMAQHRVFHAGMETPVPVMSGGTGANNASSARAALGANNAGNLNVGTLPVERLPFKYAYGTATINGVSSVYVSYSNAGFTQIPVVIATYSTTGANWSGDNGAIKVHDKTIYGCGMIVGGSFNTNRTVDWFAFGV